MNTCPPYVLAWGDVRDAAIDSFRVWVGSGDIDWARVAWEHLVGAGFANYRSELERTRVCLRFLALPSMYRDWCAVACEETQEDDFTYWAEELEIHPFHLGQLVGADVDPFEWTTFDSAEADVLQELVYHVRSEVVKVLLQGFGGPEALFLSLYRSCQSNDEEDAAADEDSDWSVLNDTTVGNLRGYEWIADGCPNVR